MELYILLLIINLNFIFSTSDCDGFTGTADSSECAKFQIKSGYNDYCCYYEPTISGTSGFCKTIPYSTYNNRDKYEYIDDILYEVKCQDKREVTLLEQCGNVNEANDASLGKCQEHSTVLNSCCYVKGNNEISKGCYWLGTKYEGEIKYAGVDMECFMDYLKFKLFYLIFLFLFF